MPWQWPWRRTHDRALFQIGDLVVPGTAAGEPVTVDSSLRLSTVWGCVRLLADSVSTLPLHVYRGEERDPLPTPPLLQRPSADFPELTDWLWAVMASLLLRGNAWGVITARAGAGLLPAQVDLAHPDHVTVNQSQGQPPEFRVGGEVVDRADLWHVKAFTFPGSLLGLSPIAYARESIGLGIAAEKFGARFFGEGAVPSGVIESDQRLNREQALQLQEMWMLRHQGHRRPAVLGAAKYRPISVAPEESQFVETQKLNAAAICRLFGVPAGMMAGVELAGHEDYSSPEQRAQDFLTFGLRPWLTRVERGISTLLPRAQAAKFNPGGLVRATLRERYEAHRIAIEAGFLTVNEVRELEDRPPLPEGGAVA
jgi:HK97 family phage portal protein